MKLFQVKRWAQEFLCVLAKFQDLKLANLIDLTLSNTNVSIKPGIATTIYDAAIGSEYLVFFDSKGT